MIALLAQAGPSLVELPWPATGGLGLVLVAVIGAWLRAVLLAQAAAKEQQDGWTGIVSEKERSIERRDREIERKDIEIDRLREVLAAARADLERCWQSRQGGSGP